MDIAVALFGAPVGQQRRPVGFIGRRETLEIADGTPLDVPTTVGRARDAVLEDVNEPAAAVFAASAVGAASVEETGVTPVGEQRSAWLSASL